MYEALGYSNLYTQIKDARLPLKTAYKFSKLTRLLEKEIAFYQEEFAKIIQTYAKKDSNGKPVYIDGETIEIMAGKEAECADKVYELKNLEIQIDGISFTIEELENLNLSIEEISCIISLIED
jgi:hypothetical protein